MKTKCFSRFGLLVVLYSSAQLVPAADITWTNSAGGAWTNRFNWSPNSVPGPADNAVINVPGQPTVTLDEVSTVTGLNLGNGTLGGTGTLIVLNSFTWSLGALIGMGTNIIAPTATFTITGPGLKQISQRTVNNSGTVIWNATAGIDIGGGAVFNNQTGALFEVQNDSFWGNGFVGGPSTFNNAGTARKTAGTGISSFGAVFNNIGAVEAQSGRLRLGGGGTHTGAFTASSGAAIDFAGGTHSLETASSVTGSGTIAFIGGTTTINGSYNVTGTTSCDGGTVNVSANASTVNLTFLSGHITGAGTLASGGAMDWTGGTFTGSGTNAIAANATLTISGAALKQLSQRTINNSGTAVWSATSGVDVGGGAIFNNQNGATFTVQNDAFWGNGFIGGPSTFNNSGTVRKTLSAGDSLFGAVFNNRGVVEVQSGRLKLGGGGTHTGSFTANSGATLDFAGGSHNLEAASSATAQGTIRFSGAIAAISGSYNVSGLTIVEAGSVSFAADATSASLGFVNGQITGSGTFRVTATTDWTGGTFSGSGTNVIDADGILTISGPALKQISQRTINNFGNAVWNATIETDIGGGAVFNNQSGATLTIQNDHLWGNGFVGGPSTFNNAGTLRKAAGAGTSTFGSELINTGTIEINAGTLRFVGPFNHVAGAVVRGINALDLSQSPAVMSAGEYKPGNQLGTLTIIGNLPQSSSAAIDIELGGRTAGVNYDQLLITGNAALNGALRIFFSGAFMPQAGDAFEVVRYASRSGAFTSMSGLDLGGGMFLSPSVTATNVLLTVSNSRAPLAFYSSRRLPNGLAEFILTNTASRSFVLQANTNLAQNQWSPVLTNFNSGLSFSFTDPDTKQFLQRFFRAQMLP